MYNISLPSRSSDRSKSFGGRAYSLLCFIASKNDTSGKVPLDEPDRSGVRNTAAAANGELWNGVDKQQLGCYKTPEFITPFRVDLNCHVAKVSKDTYEWLHQNGVDTLFSPKFYQKLIEADFPGLSSRIYVDAGPNGIDFGCKFFTWLFAMDDQMDDTAIGMSLGSSMPVFLELNLFLLWSFPEDAVLHENQTKFLEAFPKSELQKKSREFINKNLRKAKEFPVDRVYGGKLGPLASCLRDMWTTCIRTMPDAFNIRMAHTIQDYFLGDLDEARNRQNKTIPSIEEYKIIRRKTGAVDPTMVMVDLVDGVLLPSELFYSHPMQELMTAINDIICWHNDMWSFKKEVARGDVHNMVFLISHELKISSYEESAFVARQMVYERTMDLDKAAEDLLAISSSPCEHAVRRYIKTCQPWISGTQAWHEACTHYQ